MSDFFVSGMQWVNSSLWHVLSGLAFFLSLMGCSPIYFIKEGTFLENALIFLRRGILMAFPFLGLILPFAVWLGYYADSGLNLLDIVGLYIAWFSAKKFYWLWPVGWFAIGFILRFYYARYIKPDLSQFFRRIRTAQQSDKLSDITKEKSTYQAKDFLPEKYYKKNYLFVGLNAEDKPVYIPEDLWRETNMQIIGPTRRGKGVLLGTLIQQAILNQYTVIYIDPKKDAFLPHIMADTAKKAGRNFYYFDLNDATTASANPGEWAPFIGGDLRARRARLLMAAGLNPTGDESDFYKARERKVVDEILNATNGRIPSMLEELEKNEKLQEKAQRFYSMVAEWAQIQSLCPKKKAGLSVERTLLKNSVIYVRGSLDDPIIMEATRLLIMEFVQEIKRLEDKRTAHATLFIDEVRFLTSGALVDALATIAGSRANIVLAYQAKADLRNLTDRTLDGRAVEQSVDTNCQIKVVYGTQDPETAKWVAEMSGEQVKLVTRMEYTKVGHLGEETWENHRTLGQETEAYITENVVYSLPQRVGIVFLPNELAQIMYTAYVPTTKENKFNRTDVIGVGKQEEETAYNLTL